MKTLFKVLIPILLVPLSLGTVNAKVTKTKKVTTGESIYVLKTTNRKALTGEELDSECRAASPWFVISGIKADLYSIQTQSAHGRVVNDSVKKVGEQTACVLFPTDGNTATLPLYEGLAENILKFPGPTQNVNIAYSILLNGQRYLATGSGRFRTDPAWGIPYSGFYLLGATATLIKPMVGVVGSYTMNAVLAFPGPDASTENLDKQGGIAVLRIYEPG